MNKDKKLISAIVVAAIAIFLVSGGTLAYWQWATSTAQETLVNVSLTDDAKMYIDFPSEEITNMYPTSDCEENGTSSWITEITVDNGTGVLLSPNFKLKVKIEDKDGNVITNVTNPGNSNPNRHYIKFAVTAENESCTNALYTGRFSQTTETVSGSTDWYDSELITVIDESTGFPIVSGKIGSGVSFYAEPNKETSQKFRVYVWLDKEYTGVTVGTEVTDTMQDAKVTVSWSENSELEQVKKTKTGEAVAIYSADDNSLRFYRDTAANVQALSSGSISTYNGRTATAVYTGFETNSYGMGALPWNSYSSNITTVVFEDYIYPVSTAFWFEYMSSVEELDVTKLDTSNVTSMKGMFNSVSSITTLDVSNFNTANVTDMSVMFISFIGIINGIENWNTAKVTNMSDMFMVANIKNEKLDLSGWNVCNVTETVDYFTAAATGTIIEPYFGDQTKCNGGNPA